MTHREKIYAAEESVWPPQLRSLTLDTIIPVVARIAPECNVAALLVPEPPESECWWQENDEGIDEPWLFIHPNERTFNWVLHELAHILQGPDDPREHSRQWLAHYLRLVRAEGLTYIARHLRRALVPLVPKTLSK